MTHHYCIDTQQSIDLNDFDPSDTQGIYREEAEQKLLELEKSLQTCQDLLYGAAQHSVLIILQGMDTSGKDGTIKQALKSINPAGCHVWPFKVPTTEELGHDFLWRIHQRTPTKGMIAIFNRSHYEDVLIAAVHNLVPEDVWKQRYDQINDFERLLAQNNTIIIKFYLHISKEEQKERLLAREKEAGKAWKLSPDDWKERTYWAEYTKAYEKAIGKCATAEAPWYTIPANHKWYRNYLITKILVNCLKPHCKEWESVLAERGKEMSKALAAMRNKGEDVI
jgi:PPK2 family polyphosphate:nucleotide phosphotransferase